MIDESATQAEVKKIPTIDKNSESRLHDFVETTTLSVTAIVAKLD
jgi:hypothetical protein